MTLSVRSSHSSAWAVCARDDFKLLQRKLHITLHTIFCRICVGGRVPKQWTALKIQLLLVNFSEWKRTGQLRHFFSLSSIGSRVCSSFFRLLLVKFAAQSAITSNKSEWRRWRRWGKNGMAECAVAVDLTLRKSLRNRNSGKSQTDSLHFTFSNKTIIFYK